MRRQEKPGHDLPSFARYLNKVFHFRQAATKLTDSRWPRAMAQYHVGHAERVEAIEADWRIRCEHRTILRHITP